MNKSLLIFLVLLSTSFIGVQANDWTLYDSHIFGETSDAGVGSSVAISRDGTIVAIGAYRDSIQGYYSGEVKIYEVSNNNLSQIGSTINGSQSWARLGKSVALNDDGNVIALFEHLGSSASGYIKVFEWDEELDMHIPKGSSIFSTTSLSEESLALSSDGNTLLVGSWHQGMTVYDLQGNSWVRRGSEHLGVTNSQDNSGYSVAISGDGNIIVTGVPEHDSAYYGYGSYGTVRAYEWLDNEWVQLNVNTIWEEGARAGYSVDLSADGSRLVVGAKHANSSSSNIGAIQVFEKSAPGSGYSKIGQNIYGDAGSVVGGYFGASVGISSDGNIVSASGHGFIRSYEWKSYTWDKIGGDIIYNPDGIGGKAELSLDLSGDGNLIIVGESTEGMSDSGASLYSYVTPPPLVIPVLSLDAFYESQYGENITIDAVPSEGWPTNYTYQWYFNNFAIPASFGGNESNLTISGSDISNGTYAVDIANSTGAINVQFEYRVFSDNDNDGLSDYRESNILNTNPNSSDTDGDSLSDGDEVNVYFTSPSLSDTNGDGFEDGFIISNGFDIDTDYTAFSLNVISQSDYNIVVAERDTAIAAQASAEAERDSRPTQASYDAVVAERDARPTQNAYDALVAENSEKYFLNDIADLRTGSKMIEVINGQATLSMDVESSDELGSWTIEGNLSTVIPIQAGVDKKFFRFKMDDSDSSDKDINLSIGDSEYDEAAIIEALAEQYGVPASSISLGVTGG